MQASEMLTNLGHEVIVCCVLPYVGDREYLHVSTVNKNLQSCYARHIAAKFTAGLSACTSALQLEHNIRNGYGADRAMMAAARIGRVDVMESLYSAGVTVSHRAIVQLATNGNLRALVWGVSKGAIPAENLTVSVNHAALRAGHLDVFRWCIDQNMLLGSFDDLRASVAIGDTEHVTWALQTFPNHKSIIAVGIGKSSMPNALALYSGIDCTGDRDARGHFRNFLDVFSGGNIDILSHVADKLWAANVYADSHTDYTLELGVRLRYIDDNRDKYAHSWFNGESMRWAKRHPYFWSYFV